MTLVRIYQLGNYLIKIYRENFIKFLNFRFVNFPKFNFNKYQKLKIIIKLSIFFLKNIKKIP